MEIHVKEEISKDLNVLDLDTGKYIDNCISANQENGECEMHHSGAYFTETRNIVIVYKGK